MVRRLDLVSSRKEENNRKGVKSDVKDEEVCQIATMAVNEIGIVQPAIRLSMIVTASLRSNESSNFADFPRALFLCKLLEERLAP